MSFSLADLPTELIDCIVGNIESRGTLCNVARCSRHLYLCTVPYLYRHVTVKDESGPLREMPNTQLPHVASLLLSRPDLARLVRHFELESSLHLDLTENFFEEYTNPAYVEDFYELEGSDRGCKTATKSLSSYDGEKFERLRRSGQAPDDDDDLALALLLSTLSGLETVVLDLRSHHDTKHLEWMIERTASGSRPLDVQPLFESLTLFILSDDRVKVQNRGLMASLLKLPALQEISGCFGNAWDDSFGKMKATDRDLEELESASSPIVELDLTASELGKADLGHIFRAPKALRALRYQFCPYSITPITNLRSALRPQEKCLESLAFDYDETHENIHGFWKTLGVGRRLGAMPSFESFNNLKTFKTAAPLLFWTINGIIIDNLIDIFPPSLETLHLTRLVSCFPLTLEALEHLVSQKSSQQIPSLKTLILEESHCHCGNSETLMEIAGMSLDQLTDVCVAQDVALVSWCLPQPRRAAGFSEIITVEEDSYLFFS